MFRVQFSPVWLTVYLDWDLCLVQACKTSTGATTTISLISLLPGWVDSQDFTWLNRPTGNASKRFAQMVLCLVLDWLTDWLTCDCRILSVTEPLCFTVLQFTLHTGYRIRKSARCRNNWVRSTHMLYRIVIEIVHVQCSVQFSVKFGSMLRPRTFQGYVITCVQSLAEEYVGGMFGNWSDYSLINLLQITN